jgi:uncharacterized membrane protein YhaH (DUF805 family)
MDNIVGLLTSTQGRISRKSWWLGIVILIIVNLLITFLIFPMVGLGGPSAQAILDAANDPQKLTAVVTGSMQAAGWGSLILFVVFAYPQYALGVKRRHDKDNNGLDVIIFLAIMAVTFLIQALGLAYTVGNVGGVVVPVPSMLFSILGLVMLVYGIYMLVVLGFLKGTTGPNQYGPDPLAGTAAATA